MNIIKYFITAVVSSLVISCYGQNNTSLSVFDLSVEYLKDPVGIDREKPLFSWKLSSEQNGSRQTAYQIAVTRGHEDEVWNSGKVISSNSINIRYDGPPLESNQIYLWSVRVWDETGEASEWSEAAQWQMGLLHEQDWKARWISNKYAEVSGKREPFTRYEEGRNFVSEDTGAVFMRQVYDLDKIIEKATAYVTGLGYFELYINGEKIGDHIMDPVFTDYQRTVKYLAFDVGGELQQGVNHIAALLGNGFYNHQERDLFQMEKSNWKTPPKFYLQVHVKFQDGSTRWLLSDGAWQWRYGSIVYNSIRGGETIDARIDMEGWTTGGDPGAGRWQDVVEVPAPLGKMSRQYMSPMRETRSFEPLRTWTVGEDTVLFDFGENLTGYADIELAGPAGRKVAVFYNETLNKDSTLHIKYSSGHTWGRFQRCELILSNDASDRFEPRFTYHGFRYVQVVGVPPDAIKDITARAVHTDLHSIGTFECSNERLNQLHAAVRRTLLNSIHGMPGEEPTREKMGWTLDGLTTMEAYLLNFDAINVYKKYLEDLIDSQEENGHIPPIVPTNGWGFLEKGVTQEDTITQYDDPWWGGTIAYVAWHLWKYTGDTAIIAGSYDAVKAYTDFVASTAQDDIVYWSLGDWLDLTHNQNGWGPGLTPVEQTSTAGYYYLCNTVSDMAGLLNREEEARQYHKHAQRIKSSFNKKYLDTATGWYTENSQTAQALPLYLGMVPDDMKEKVLQRLLDDILAKDVHPSVGFLGVLPMMKFLSENGYRELAYQMLIQEKSPGWLHFVKNERSTMGENLNAKGYGTAHHPFASNIGFYLYYYLGGIQPDLTRESDFTIMPGLDTGLDWARVSYESLLGTVKSNWYKEDENYVCEIDIPANATATFKFPENFSLENGSDSISSSLYEKGTWKEMVLPSGSYKFILKKKL